MSTSIKLNLIRGLDAIKSWMEVGVKLSCETRHPQCEISYPHCGWRLSRLSLTSTSIHDLIESSPRIGLKFMEVEVIIRNSPDGECTIFDFIFL
jgi:hypothetical protein